MFFPDGIFTFAVLLIIYLGFISWKMKVLPWKLWFYDSREEKKNVDRSRT